MRRVRLKVAPNLVSGPRSSKPAITNVVNDPKNEETTLCIDEPIAVQDLPPSTSPSSLTLEARNVDNSLSHAAVLPLPAKPVVDTEPPVQEVTSHCIDKENVITGVSDEVSSENLVNSSSNEQNTSASSLPRYKPKNKIRPVITHATHRIRTFSSASESEDDLAKRQSRTPLSPVKKSPAKMDNVEATPLPTKTVTEKGKKGRKKRNEKTPLEMKKALMRQKFAKGEVDRSKLTMFDLIYYNPDDGERPPNATEKLQMRLKPYEVEALSLENQAEREETTGNTILDERLAEEEEMRQIEDNPQTEINDEDKQPDETDEDKQIADVEVVEEEEEEEDAMPVPQVRLGPDGEIILDERSLVIDTSETKRNKNQLANAPIIIENSSTTVNYGSWRKRPRAGRWSVKETARFYRALNMLGTNFSLMVKLFPGRDRIDLKRKFKSEEKTNPSLVDKIIATQIPFDISQFMDVEDEDSSGNESTSKEPSKKKTAGKTSNTRKVSKTSKEPKMKRKEKVLKNSNTQEPANDDECASDVEVLGESLESLTKKVPGKNSDEEVEPPSKKGKKLRVAESESPVGSRKPAGSRIGKLKGTKNVSQCDSDGDCPTSENTTTIQPTGPEKNAHLTSPNNPLDNLLNSPLGQIGLEQGGLTVVENAGASKQTPSFLVPPALAEANPAFAQAEPGSLVLVSEPNPGDPNNQLVHVYRISVPVEPVPL
ncbi:hypothetical protein GHT06_017802 [Daphnia sinensis]|uniref:Myb-like domain-containing protein n=1 Tax=Daphnia sinensis TaxID=1820382 RepID=A0AAD5PQC4_9CRUS|nr:hypothetical protein GHT06_017802 [Daphnia sinensis]